ncbi:MAG: hypothetical protein K6F86_00925 [Lachnospiraceae bacterium]|nr:hypothetical protein [Lachnospiraceae bacterium]
MSENKYYILTQPSCRGMESDSDYALVTEENLKKIMSEEEIEKGLKECNTYDEVPDLIEFGAMNAPSISALFVSEKYEHQQEIIDYLENGRIVLAAPGLEIDEFTGETIMPRHTKTILTDGVYSWSGSLPYYVEKYNVRLPLEIEDWILSQYSKE